jgi:thioredoxin-related protein
LKIRIPCDRLHDAKKRDFLSSRRRNVKRLFLSVAVLTLIVLNMSCAKPDYKKVTTDFITASGALKDYTIREVADTSSSKWKAVIVYVKQGRANTPLLFFVSSDGKSIVPNAMVYENNKPIFERRLETEFGRIDFRLTEKDRFIYNPSGKKLVYMFSDPDCPYCTKAKEKLQTYNGEYRVIIKYFPLEEIHPGATQKAIREQAEWLKKNRKDLMKDADILKEAKRMVEEDIREAKKAEIAGVPMYVMEDGTLKQGLF